LAQSTNTPIVWKAKSLDHRCSKIAILTVISAICLSFSTVVDQISPENLRAAVFLSFFCKYVSEITEKMSGKKTTFLTFLMAQKKVEKNISIHQRKY
jgi:hypothetical protein